eukprot:c11419_g1_i1.p1 GENE.c11419_g1_i1~~c11419_g1_i1.p1  ORF type:complete len:481 (-),score=127.30 c11419_g1_i1:114-1556(-)
MMRARPVSRLSLHNTRRFCSAKAGPEHSGKSTGDSHPPPPPPPPPSSRRFFAKTLLLVTSVGAPIALGKYLDESEEAREYVKQNIGPVGTYAASGTIDIYRFVRKQFGTPPFSAEEKANLIAEKEASVEVAKVNSSKVAELERYLKETQLQLHDLQQSIALMESDQQYRLSEVGQSAVVVDQVAAALYAAKQLSQKEKEAALQQEQLKWQQKIDIIREEHNQQLATQAQQLRDAHRAELKKAIESQTAHLKEKQKIEVAKAIKSKDHEFNLERVVRYGDIEDLRNKVQFFKKALDECSDWEKQSHLLHRMTLVANTLTSSLDSKTPFSVPVAYLSRVAGDNDLVKVVTNSLDDTTLSKGVQSHTDLISRFPKVVSAARHAELVPDDTGLWGELLAMATNFLTIRVLHSQGHDTTEGILVRAEQFVRANNIAAAVAELERLQGKPREAVNGWVADARRRVTAKLASDMIQAESGLIAASGN